ncbi:hypothetical protein CC80DRAFT_70756 [Byssothecium circinans]|uniref:Uncharacterized protein n=1 Tax=Byssothecium circinans TaxID=147558 RepID=A0A6A5TTA9_9PLEO|nr:hypothetical protein CC80DRAFT_70756 [Byssothecium circinans]
MFRNFDDMPTDPVDPSGPMMTNAMSPAFLDMLGLQTETTPLPGPLVMETETEPTVQLPCPLAVQAETTPPASPLAMETEMIPLPAPFAMQIPLPGRFAMFNDATPPRRRVNLEMRDYRVRLLLPELRTRIHAEIARHAFRLGDWDPDMTDNEVMQMMPYFDAEDFEESPWTSVIDSLRDFGIDTDKIEEQVWDAVTEGLVSGHIDAWAHSHDGTALTPYEVSEIVVVLRRLKSNAPFYMMPKNRLSLKAQVRIRKCYFCPPLPLPAGFDPSVDLPPPRLAKSGSSKSAPKIDEVVAPAPTFHRFEDLPDNVLLIIYGMILYTGQPIRPHLCVKSEKDGKQIKFHDDAQENDHNSISKLLGITQTSKEVRGESLEAFYGVNTFATVADTPTYFNHLAHLGRFHLIRNVCFPITFKRDDAPFTLALLRQVLEEQKSFEESHIAAEQAAVEETAVAETDGEETVVEQESGQNNELEGKQETSQASRQTFDYNRDPKKFHTGNRDVLTQHPDYTAGGLPWINTFLVLQKLTSEFTSNDANAEYSHKLVVHVPSKDVFFENECLAHFPGVCEGLGIQVKWVEGADPRAMAQWGVVCFWHQKFQKKNFDSNVPDAINTEKILKKTKQMYPDAQDDALERHSFYRRDCSQSGAITWFTVTKQ